MLPKRQRMELPLPGKLRHARNFEASIPKITRKYQPKPESMFPDGKGLKMDNVKKDDNNKENNNANIYLF